MRIVKSVRFAFFAGIPIFCCTALVSCNSSPQSAAGVNGLTADEAGAMNANSSKFSNTDIDPPFTAQTHFAAGQLQEYQGAFPQALAQYREALKLDPKHEASLFRASVVLAQLKQYPQAIDMCKRYIAVTNGSAVGYSNLGFCYELAGNQKDAEVSYQQAIARDPKCEAARNNYGSLLTRTGRLDEAMAQLSAVHKPAEACYNIASVLEQTGKRDQAKLYFNKVLQLDPKFVDAKKRLAALN